MYAAEGEPGEIFCAFSEDNNFEESILCLFLSNRAADTAFFISLLENCLEIDSKIQDKIAIVLISSEIKRPLYTKIGNTGHFFPGWVSDSLKQRNNLRLISEGSQYKEIEEVKRAVERHRVYAEKMCLYLGIDPADMPYCVMAARGVSLPWALPIKTNLEINEIKQFLDGLVKLAAEIDSYTTRAHLDVNLMRGIIHLYEKNSKKIRDLHATIVDQLDRFFRYNPNLPLNVKEKSYVQFEATNFNVDKFLLENDLDLTRLKSYQSLQKAVRIQKDILGIQRESASLIDDKRTSLERTIAYFRDTEGSEARFKAEVKALVKSIGRGGVVGKIVHGIEVADSTTKKVSTFIEAAKRVLALASIA
jgi:hypothetical protein